MTQLFYRANPPFGRHRRNAAVGQSPSLGRHTRPDFAPKVQISGSQRVPLLMGMNANGGADAGHKRRPENRLMVRRRERSRMRGPGVRRTFESVLRSKTYIAARLRASRQYQGPDPTGRRGSFTRSSLLVIIGQIRKDEATPQTLRSSRGTTAIACRSIRNETR